MKKFILSAIVLLGMCSPSLQAKDLVVYFSAQGHTQAVAQRIAELTSSDIFSIEPAEPYASNPYNDSDRIQREAYNNLRPGVANLPTQEWIDQYDRIYVGSPCWWHQPAMVVCTFLESFDLSKHVIIPFMTYAATTYLNESMQRLYKSTPNSVHVPATLPEDLDPDDITTPGRSDDDGIDMPGNANGVEGWLTRLGLLSDNSGISSVTVDGDEFAVSANSGTVTVNLSENMTPNVVSLYNLSGALLGSKSGATSYSFSVPENAVYLLDLIYGAHARRVSKKISM